MAFPVIWHHLRQRTTGQSAGNTHEEAIVHGIYEVLERHALTRVASERIATPAIDLDSVEEPELRELIARLRQQGIALAARDISPGLGVPLIAVIFDDRASRLSGHPLFGRLNPTVIAAARAEPEQAILHCLHEFIEDAPPSTPEEESEVLTQWALRTSLVGARGVPLPDDVGISAGPMAEGKPRTRRPGTMTRTVGRPSTGWVNQNTPQGRRRQARKEATQA